PVALVIVPTPVTIQAGSGEFIVSPATAIVVPANNEQVAKIGRYLSAFIGIAAGPEPPAAVTEGSSSPASAIRLTVGHAAAAGDEGYELTVASDRVVISANTPAGLFYGVQTLRQLLPPFVEYEAVRADKTLVVRAPSVHVVDHPRYVWRGAMLDVARHFFP